MHEESLRSRVAWVEMDFVRHAAGAKYLLDVGRLQRTVKCTILIVYRQNNLHESAYRRWIKRVIHLNHIYGSEVLYCI